MNLYLMLATVCLSVSAFAQPVHNAGSIAEIGIPAELQAARQAARDLRRIELRLALQSYGASDVQVAKTYDARLVNYHLSPKELAEMRQQLRQQQTEVSKYRP